MSTFGVRSVPSSVREAARMLGMNERALRKELKWWATRLGTEHYEFWTPRGYIIPYGFWISIVEEVEEMKLKPKLLKRVDKWVDVLATTRPDRLVDMAKEVYRYEVRDGSAWKPVGYQLLLKDDGDEKVSIDTTGTLEIIHKGKFATIPLDAYEHKNARKAYYNLIELKAVLDGRWGE